MFHSFAHNHLRVFALIATSLIAAPRIFAQDANVNSELPPETFQALIAGKDATQIPAEFLVESRGLTADQRLRATVEIRIPPNQIAARHGAAALISMTQMTDARGRTFLNWNRIDLATFQFPPNAEYVSVIFNAFVLPGDYKIAVVVYDSATKECSVAHRALRVEKIRRDPLPGTWNDLPSVEFWPAQAPMETIKGKLQIAVKTKRPVRIVVLLDSTFTKGVKPSQNVYQQSLATLIPEFQTLTEISPSNGAVDAAVLDLTQQKVTFEQDDVTSLDWRRLEDALTTTNADVISASSLESQGHEAQYFVSEVMRRIAPEGSGADRDATNALRAVIVLSGPMSFHSRESASPIEIPGDCHCRVYYIRSHALEPESSEPIDDTNPTFVPFNSKYTPDLLEPTGSPPAPPSDACPQNNCNYDELESTLAALQPRVYDVYSPLDFRKALGSILNDLGNL